LVSVTLAPLVPVIVTGKCGAPDVDGVDDVGPHATTAMAMAAVKAPQV
jgi:hypothetical protein